MVLKKGDFVKINFTGKIKETREIFDTTYEKIAKENNIYDPKMIFKARPVIIGARHILPGIDKKLVGADLGEKKKIEIAPEDGFGKRDPLKVKVIPLREFKKRDVNPIPGMRIEIDDTVGRVQSVGGGRVRVDLNHGLAGKILVYEVKVEEKTNKSEEKIRQLLELYIPGVDSQEFGISLKDKKAEIILPDSLKLDPSASVGKISAVRDIFTFIDVVDEVGFKEIHRRMGAPAKNLPTTTKKPKSKKKTPKSA
jgi:peptidylprolyl isomerase/FKBP-type peptidyl-prolyl cis-trans isomerase SlyD